MKSTIEKVAEFHKMTNCPILETPTIPSIYRCQLRVGLIQEELNELAEALEAGDLVGVADALTDLQYVLDGAYLEFGMKDIKEPLFDEVQRSNMSKSCATEIDSRQEQAEQRAKGVQCTVQENDGKFILVRSDGKTIKPSTYSPADLKAIVFPETVMPYRNPEIPKGQKCMRELERISKHLSTNSIDDVPPATHKYSEGYYTCRDCNIILNNQFDDEYK